MATERCPVCDVPVKAANLARHLETKHPRDAKAAAARERLRKEAPRGAGRPPRVRFWLRPIHGVAVAVVAIVILAVFLVPRGPSTNASFSVDSCISDASVAYHIHPDLSILIQANRYPIPRNIGVTAGCVKPLHTHDSDYDPATQPATIHVESPVARSFTLGEFFHVWGQILRADQVLTYPNDGTNVVRMTVDGAPSTAFGSLVFADGQRIVITYGP